MKRHFTANQPIPGHHPLMNKTGTMGFGAASAFNHVAAKRVLPWAVKRLRSDWKSFNPSEVCLGY